MKEIRLNKSVIEGGLNEATLTGLGYVYAVNNRIADTRAKLTALTEKSELTAVQLEQIDVLTERIGELEAALTADDIRPYANWFDAMLASDQAEAWMDSNRVHLAILASWHGGGWLPVNVDRLYEVFTGLLTGNTEKADAKKALNAFLCIFRKGGDLLKGIKVSVNNAELDTWKAVMLNGFSKDKRTCQAVKHQLGKVPQTALPVRAFSLPERERKGGSRAGSHRRGSGNPQSGHGRPQGG